MSELLYESDFCDFPCFYSLPPFISCLEMRGIAVKAFWFYFFNQRKHFFFFCMSTFYREVEPFSFSLWHTPLISVCSFFSLGLVVLIGDILTVPLGVQQTH